MDTEKARAAMLRMRKAGQDFVVEVTAAIRELDEALEEVPTVRPPQDPMEPVRVEVVKLPTPRRPR